MFSWIVICMSQKSQLLDVRDEGSIVLGQSTQQRMLSTQTSYRSENTPRAASTAIPPLAAPSLDYSFYEAKRLSSASISILSEVVSLYLASITAPYCCCLIGLNAGSWHIDLLKSPHLCILENIRSKRWRCRVLAIDILQVGLLFRWGTMCIIGTYMTKSIGLNR